ncbi:MAG: hypothetical protein P8P74_10350 [Crocinitomicaceae bacterium]|nr:hypothetical protein [Crocinitomicaceae bacterium]
MVSVSAKQIDFILDDIGAHGIESEDLKDNLLDHICCIVENEMNTEDDFYEFYERILPRFFTDELREIQEETDKLLTFKDYYAMKNTLVKSGLISSGLTLLGILFKIMHWPGASMMLVLGVAIFGLLFIPLMIVLKFKDEAKPIDKWVLSAGLILGMTTSVGVLFKVMHWPFASILILSSLAAFILLFVPTYFITRVRRADLKFNTTVNSVLMMACACLLFALFRTSSSEKYLTRTTATQEYLIEQVNKVNKANEEIVMEVKDFKEFDELHTTSRAMFEKINNIKVNLIAKAENISVGKAKDVAPIELAHPDDFLVVLDGFVHSKSELGMEALLDDVENYNEVVSENYPDREEKILDMDKLQLENCSISIILSELSQIQLQIATNENAYLNLLAAN